MSAFISVITSWPLPLTLPLPFYRTLWLHWAHLDNPYCYTLQLKSPIFITPAVSVLKVTYSQFQGLGWGWGRRQVLPIFYNLLCVRQYIHVMKRWNRRSVCMTLCPRVDTSWQAKRQEQSLWSSTQQRTLWIWGNKSVCNRVGWIICGRKWQEESVSRILGLQWSEPEMPMQLFKQVCMRVMSMDTTHCLA